MTDLPATRREARLAASAAARFGVPSGAEAADEEGAEPIQAAETAPIDLFDFYAAAFDAPDAPVDAAGWDELIEGAEADARAEPVFVDPSGRRSRRVRAVVAAAVGGALIYIVFLAVALFAHPGVASPLLPLIPAPAAGPVQKAPVAHSASPSTGGPTDAPTPSGTWPAPAASPTGGVSPVVTPAPPVAPRPSPSPTATAPGHSGSAPKHTPQPKPTGKP